MNVKKIERKIKRGLLIGIPSAILIICLLKFVIAFLLFLPFMPYTKTKFWNYESFRKKVEYNYFPEQLPESATDIKYYYYTGQLDEKYVVSFVLNEEDYEKMKQEYLSRYEELHTEKEFTYFFDEELTVEFVEQDKIEFVEEVMHEEIENYSILAYQRCNSTANTVEGVLVNEKTHEMIILYFHDTLKGP